MPEFNLIPSLFFEKGHCGQLTPELKIKTLERCLEKIVTHCKCILNTKLDLNFPGSVLISSVVNEWDDRILEFSWNVLQIHDEFFVPCLMNLKDMFKVVKIGLETRTGPTVAMVLDLVVNSNFSEEIVKKYSSLPAEQISVFENVVFYIYLTSDTKATLNSLKGPLKRLVLQTAEYISAKIELARRIMLQFDGQSYEAEIELYFAVYDQDFIRKLPKESACAIAKRLSDSQEFYAKYDDPLRLLAVVLSGLVYAKQFKPDSTSPYFSFFTILKLGELEEVPGCWREKFELILREQVPRLAKIIINSEIKVLPEDFVNCIDLLLRYAPTKVTTFAASIAAASGIPEVFLNAMTDNSEIFKLTLYDLLLKGVKLKSESLHLSSTAKELIDLLQQK